MANGVKEKQGAEELKETDEKVRKALEETAGPKPTEPPKVETTQKLWIGTYILLILAFGTLYYLIRLGFFGFVGEYAAPMQRLTAGAMAVVLVLAAQKAVK